MQKKGRCTSHLNSRPSSDSANFEHSEWLRKLSPYQEHRETKTLTLADQKALVEFEAELSEKLAARDTLSNLEEASFN